MRATQPRWLNRSTGCRWWFRRGGRGTRRGSSTRPGSLGQRRGVSSKLRSPSGRLSWRAGTRCAPRREPPTTIQAAGAWLSLAIGAVVRRRLSGVDDGLCRRGASQNASKDAHIHAPVRSVGEVLDRSYRSRPGTHSLRRTKPTLIYRRTQNLRAVQLLLGHTKLESTVRYLGIEVDDALAIAEQTEV